MSTSKHIDKICLAGAILSLVLMLVFLNGEALGIQAASRVMGYEQRLVTFFLRLTKNDIIRQDR